MSYQPVLLASVAGAMILGAGGATHAHGQTPCRHRAVSPSVRVHNNAAVPDDVLRNAKAYAAAVYGRIGVELNWLDSFEANAAVRRRPYTLVLMTSQTSDTAGTGRGIADDIVGQAVSVAGRAYVHYDRVAGVVQPPDRDLVTYLGYVMAHELGHLMLPGRRHAVAGIMRAGFPLTSRSAVTFTPVEAALICGRLQREANGRDDNVP